MQTVGRNSTSLRRQLINRRERAPRQHVAAGSSQHDDNRKPEHENDKDFRQLRPEVGFRP